MIIMKRKTGGPREVIAKYTVKSLTTFRLETFDERDVIVSIMRGKDYVGSLTKKNPIFETNVEGRYVFQAKTGFSAFIVHAFSPVSGDSSGGGGSDCDCEELERRIDTKAGISYVDSKLSEKADITYVDAGLADKADMSYVDAELAALSTANLPNAATAGADKIPVTNSSGDGWDYIAAIVDPERPVRLGDTSLRANVKVTVGAGGDFPTINAAVLHLSRFTPDLGVTAEVELQSGFVMMEQLFVEGLDLGWITITGVDAETVINEPSLTRVLVDNNKPAFGVINGTLPIIGQLFSFSSKGSLANLRSGVMAHSVGRATILAGCGVKNAGVYGICALEGATINAVGADASGAGSSSIYALGGSTINALLANASGAGSRGIFATQGSTISAENANASGAGSYGISATRGATINVQSANASGAGTNGIYVYRGSTINAYGATGTLSQAENTVTAHGIIFK